MRHFGYFMTESTGHLSEYLPYFRKNKKALEMYCDQPSFGGESGAYYKWSKVISKKFAKADPLAFETTELAPRSAEYCSCIIEAIETDKIFRFNGNIRNEGLITNLPGECCAEVPIFADRNGLNATFIGDLPPQCAAANLLNVNCQGLTVEAALTGDPELAFAAMAMDPLTAAVCTLNEIREMTIEMLEAQRKWLPEFRGRKLRHRKPIVIPKGTRGVEVPADPALAIGQRFVKLIDVKTTRPAKAGRKAKKK
jgi:alpha-galactosidase